MVQIWKPFDISVYRSWVDAIISEASDNLNDWETQFIDSIEQRLNFGNNLTEPQAGKLEQLYTKHTS